MSDVDARVRYSRDQDAVAEMERWLAAVAELPRRRVLERRRAESHAEEAREPALAAGIDWSLVPRPPDGLRAPDRSRRDGAGAAPPQPGGSAALNGLKLTVQLAGAPVEAARAAERGDGAPRQDGSPGDGGGSPPP